MKLTTALMLLTTLGVAGCGNHGDLGLLSNCPSLEDRLTLYPQFVSMPAGADISKTLAGNETVSCNFFLAPADPSAIEKASQSINDPKSPNYLNFNGPFGVKQLLAPDSKAIQQLSNTLQNFEIPPSSLSVSPSGFLIKVTTTAEKLACVLNKPFVEISDYNTQVTRAAVEPNGDIQLPKSIAPYVQAVSGCVWLPVNKHRAYAVEIPQADLPIFVVPTNLSGMMTPVVLSELYGVPSSQPGKAQFAQAVAGFIGQYYESNANALFTQFTGLPIQMQTLPTNDFPSCAAGNPPLVCSSPGEANLDVEYINTFTSGAPTWFWSQPMDAFILDYAASILDQWILSNGASVSEFPYIHSISYGTNEFLYPLSYQQATDQIFAALGTAGFSFFVSSGDGGSSNARGFDAAPNNQIVSYPSPPAQWLTQEFVSQYPEFFQNGIGLNAIPCGTVTARICGDKDCSQTLDSCYVPQGFNNSDARFDCTKSLFPKEEASPQQACFNALEKFVALNSGCDIEYELSLKNADNPSPSFFYSSCQCADLKPVTVQRRDGNYCRIEGYSVSDTSTPMFAPSFPGTLPHVTSVGATMLSGTANSKEEAPYCTSTFCDSSLQNCFKHGPQLIVGGGQSPSLVFSNNLIGPITDLASFITSQNTHCAQGRAESFASAYSGSLITGGGGFSDVFQAPGWQQNAVQNYLQTASQLPPLAMFNAQGRGFPDLSFNGHTYWTSGGTPHTLNLVDGTSASAPALASMFARLEADIGYPLGFLNPLLYQMAAANKGFTNIQDGFSGCGTRGSFCYRYGFSGAPGWDPLTGLGTPKYDEMRAYVCNVCPKNKCTGC